MEIGDTDPGTPADVKAVFEPFFTTKPVGQGTRPGLETSWRIVVNKHHGEIRVESRPGDTRFQVVLPLEATAQPMCGARAADDPSRTTSPVTSASAHPEVKLEARACRASRVLHGFGLMSGA